MIRDDASQEELERWYRRTPEEIEAERRQKWNAEWNALRTPEHLAREPDTGTGRSGLERARDDNPPVQIAARPNPGVPGRRHIEAYEIGPDGKLQFTPEYAKHAEENYRRLMKAQDDVNYWTSLGDIPDLFKIPAILSKKIGPLMTMLSGAGFLTGTLSRYAEPPPKRK